tara:strand:+ start:161 stop:628 length:468 start_codon:yes stop_codon:yes gene_type:complete
MKQKIHLSTEEQMENFETGLSNEKITVKTPENLSSEKPSIYLNAEEVGEWLNSLFIELLKFEEVLKAFKQGKPISRQSKSEEYLFIYKQIPAKIDVSIVPAMTSVPDEVKEVMKKLEKGFHYKNQAVQVDKNGNVTYWIPTVEDLLAEDWYILED